jgi:XTP/dITP diphosphohydrolase
LPKLLLATNNNAKVREYKALLADLPCRLVTLADEGIDLVVEEVGESLEENARLKATLLAARSRLITLADDSGLWVDALCGEPGRLSARYAGENATDRDRVNYLLKKLEGVPREKRTARFKCVIALATPEGRVELCKGECEGLITFQPEGERGFGYDPIFYLPELRKTMAELTLEEKNKVSHRARAAWQAPEALANLLSATHLE